MELPTEPPRHDVPVTIARGKHLALVARDGWEYVSRPGASGVVAVVAVTDEDELVLVEQHRPPIGRPTLELPAGLIGDHPDNASEDAGVAARRELEEETGFTAGTWHRLGACVSSGGLTDETVGFFAASGLERVGPGGGVGRERIRVILVKLADFDEWIAERTAGGGAVDAKVYAGVAMMRHHRGWN